MTMETQISFFYLFFSGFLFCLLLYADLLWTVEDCVWVVLQATGGADKR